jgi:hypothetical protein
MEIFADLIEKLKDGNLTTSVMLMIAGAVAYKYSIFSTFVVVVMVLPDS